MKFPQNVGAGKWTFIRLSDDESLKDFYKKVSEGKYDRKQEDVLEMGMDKKSNVSLVFNSITNFIYGNASVFDIKENIGLEEEQPLFVKILFMSLKNFIN